AKSISGIEHSSRHDLTARERPPLQTNAVSPPEVFYKVAERPGAQQPMAMGVDDGRVPDLASDVVLRVALVLPLGLHDAAARQIHLFARPGTSGIHASTVP